ncbi:hypothetical protein CIB84_015762, partial [Bambusicola thoracicus]
ASEPSKFTLAVSPVDPPGTPDYIDVTRETVTLKWTPPLRDGGSKIVAYSIEKRQGSEDRWLRCNFTDVSECQYTVTGLSPGDRYEFRVLARNAVGTISPPSQSSGYIMTRDENVAPTIEFGPEHFEGLTVKAGESIRLKALIKGRPVPKVMWFKDGKEIEKTMSIEITTGIGYSTIFIRDATRDHRGVYTVEAKNASGTKREDITFRIQDAPGKVGGPIRFTNITGEKVTLWWEPPANDGCASISHYVIEKRETSRIAWALVDDKCEACSYTALKLIKGNEYQFRVSAVNKFGVGRPLESDPVVAQIPYTLPDAPGTPEPTNITGDSITLTWARPKSDGGSEINEYILERREKKSMRWVKVSSKRPIAENRYRVTGLIEGNEYEFHVMAENAAGVGPPSDVSKLIKCREPVSPPSAPNVVRVTDTSKTSVSLEWTKPVFDGGMEIIGYIIEMCKADLETWQKVNAETVLATKYTVVDLEAGEHYKFRVSAVNGAGKGESCEVPASVQTVDRLSAPEIDIDANFKQTHIVRAGATIRLFIAFSGRPVPTAVWSKADANLSLRADIQTTDSFSTLTVEECNRNDAGKYVFTVENNSGSKSITFTVKVLDTPGPPGPITFKDVTRGSITLMWDAPVLDGGSRIHHYVVEKREASRRSWQVVSSKCTRQIFKVTDLAEGVPYYYRVSAENEYGVGEPCELTEPVVATEEPAPPKRLDIIDTTKSSVVLAWLKPDHDGGSRVTGYLLEMKQKGSDKWIPAGQTKQLTFTVEGLVENTEYEFRVKAKNDAGYSEPREAFSSVIIKEPQIEPTADLSE